MSYEKKYRKYLFPRNSDEPRIDSGHYNLETSPSAPASARRIRPQQSSSGKLLPSIFLSKMSQKLLEL